jgi:Tfp pilus assembly PilM family ATPase
MFGLLKKLSYPIGIDISDDSLKIVQLENKGRSVGLLAGFSESRPEDIQAGGGNWQRWAIDVIRQWTTVGNFQSKEVIAAIPANDVFIELMKKPKVNEKELHNTIYSKIKQKLPFEPVQENIMLKYFPTIDDNILVMATQRAVIEGHLAIYEKAGLAIKSMSAWPIAMVNCYTRFFGRRQNDLESVVMLVDIENECTNVVICRHRNLLFARTISIGSGGQNDESEVTRLIMELIGCRRQFTSMYNNFQIERLIFLSSRAEDRDICATIAKKMEMPAQVGDCLAAAETADPYRLSREDKNYKGLSGTPIDRRNNQVNWAIAFGLSLSS